MWFFTLVVVLLIGAVAVVASGRWGGMNEAYDDRPDMRVPTNRLLEAGDIESSRFGVGVRGYRMDEVDSLLERLAREVAERDRRIADLERAMRPFVQGADGTGFNPVVPEGAQDGLQVSLQEGLQESTADESPVGRHAARLPIHSGPDQSPDSAGQSADDPAEDHDLDAEDEAPIERRA
jgi:DivIVA domain-containing protein